MTAKELRKLKRAELLDILYYLQNELGVLKQENEELKQQLEVNRKTPEGFAQQIEQVVRDAVSVYFAQKPSEKKVSVNNNGEQVGSGRNGGYNDANE